MTTITISLPDDLADKADRVSLKEGFATRSEFIRHLLRNYLKTDEFELEDYKKIPLETLKNELESTGKYNHKFIDSVIRGVRKSSFYADKAA